MMAMEMVEAFEEIMFEVGGAHGLTAWYEIYDSEVFEEVEAAIRAQYEDAEGFEEAFESWVDEMSEEL